MTFKGECWLENTGLVGWVRDIGNDTPLWVELLADDEPLGITLANLDYPQTGGFWLPIPPSILDDEVILRARVANRDYTMTAASGATGKEPAGVIGEIFVERGHVIKGWARDAGDPDKKLRICARVGENEFSTAVANEPRFRPEKANEHGFTLFLPLDIASDLPPDWDGLVEIRDEKGRSLPGSPVRVLPLAENAADWLKNRQKLEKQDHKLLTTLLRHMDRYIADGCGFDKFKLWREVFPPEKPQEKFRISLGLIADESTQSTIARQAGVEINLKEKKPQYYLFLAKGDSLHPYALGQMLVAMRDKKAAGAYADGENEDGLPLFKSAWDREAFFARDYLGPFLVSAECLPQLEQGDDYAALRVKAALNAEKNGGIVHVPMPLAREARIENTTDRNGAISEWLNSVAAGSKVELNERSGLNRIHYHAPKQAPVSIIIPTRDNVDMLARCLASLRDTAWGDFEIIVVDNDSSEKETLEFFADLGQKANIRVVKFGGVFNYAAMNNAAVELARGELVCFLNNDTEALSPNWLKELANPLLAVRNEVGCVGAKLVWPGGLVQHGGVVVGVRELACHVGNQWLHSENGYMENNRIMRRYSAVTAACLLTPKKLFQNLGGFDARSFPVNFNDVDYCLRVGEAGKKILWTPHAMLLHHESASRGRDDAGSRKKRAEREMGLFRKKWGWFQDPFYNPNLALATIMEPFSCLAFPPRPRTVR